MASIETYLVTSGSNNRERTRYMVRYRTPENVQKKKKGFKTKAEAQRFLNNIEVAKDRNEYVDPRSSRVEFETLAAGWLRRKESMLAKSAYRPLESAYRIHVEPMWGKKLLSQITTTSVEEWIYELMQGTSITERKPLGASMVIRCHEVLSGILDVAVNDKKLLSNPARGVDLPRKQSKEQVFLTHKQVAALAHESERKTLILTLAYTGIRWGEAAGLQVKHVDLSRNRLKIERNLVEITSNDYDEKGTKSGKPRSVPIPNFLKPYLKEAVRNKLPTASVFTEPDGSPLKRPSSHSGWFVKALRAAECPKITPHDLRHSAASFAVSSGAHVKAVQRMLGHESASMTLDVYADLFDTDLDNVASALDSLVTSQGFLPTGS